MSDAYALMMQRRFAQLDAENPRVGRAFDRYSFEAIATGQRHYSADAVMHRVRWYTDIELRDGESYKISNVWVAFYARKFMRQHPEHKGFFRLRRSMADQPGDHDDPPPANDDNKVTADDWEGVFGT